MCVLCLAGTCDLAATGKHRRLGDFGMRASAEVRRRIRIKGRTAAFSGQCFFFSLVTVRFVSSHGAQAQWHLSARLQGARCQNMFLKVSFLFASMFISTECIGNVFVVHL